MSDMIPTTPQTGKRKATVKAQTEAKPRIVPEEKPKLISEYASQYGKITHN